MPQPVTSVTGFAMTGGFTRGAVQLPAAGWGQPALRICKKGCTKRGGRGRTPTLRTFGGFCNGRTGASAPTDNKKCCESGRRGNRRSAASGGRSELISRKCPDWRPRQWPGIGWHDGGQPPAPTKFYRNLVRRGGALPLPRATARVAPTEGLQEVRCGEKSPSHGFAVPAPFRQGGL